MLIQLFGGPFDGLYLDVSAEKRAIGVEAIPGGGWKLCDLRVHPDYEGARYEDAFEKDRAGNPAYRHQVTTQPAR